MGRLPVVQGPEVIVGHEFADDAAVVRFGADPNSALVMTTDTIAPLVDDPSSFGMIAAANALSDVYAMGGRPLYALNLVFFPDHKLPLEVLSSIMQGAEQICASVGVHIVGGHSVRNDDLKFGLAVVGQVTPGTVLSNRSAQPGDVLVLSKGVGTGVIGTAIKQGAAPADVVDAAVASMCRLNREALEVGRQCAVSACTDVTGFGVAGHLRNVLVGSALSALVELDALPLLKGALELARAGYVPGGSRANLQTLSPHIRADLPQDGDRALRLALFADAQTSGGLLLCLPERQAAEALAELLARGHQAALIGRLCAPDQHSPAGTIQLV